MTAAPPATDPHLSRIQLWSCGGGRQSAGIAAFIVQGRLPKPDHVAMVALEWEKRTTFEYVNAYIRPAIRALGIPFTYVSRKKYDDYGLWGGADGRTLLIPAHSNITGQSSKLSEFCSGKWKRDVMARWANEQPGWKKRGVDNWIGISWEERRRRRGPRKKWFQAVYPLLDFLPQAVHVSACLQAVEEAGWPLPPRSRCTHCPNQGDAEWAELTAEEFEAVCRMEDDWRKIDPNAFAHKSLIPLRQVVLQPKAESDGLFGGCQAGMCF